MNNVPSSHWGITRSPINTVPDPSPIPMMSNINPTLPNDLDSLPFQREALPPCSANFALLPSAAFSLDPPSQATDMDQLAVLTSQGRINIERPAKGSPEARPSNGNRNNSCRGAHKRHNPYFLEDAQGNLEVTKARNEASGQLGASPSVFKHTRAQNPQCNRLASSPGKQKRCEDTLIRLLDASPQPMPKKAILEAIRREAVCKNEDLSEVEWRAYKVKHIK